MVVPAEPGVCDPGTPWVPPAWLESRQFSDARFGRAYEALGDQGRALIKRAIALHFALDPPRAALESALVQRFPLMERQVREAPVPFALILTDALFDAPAFFLAALMPALAARVPLVLALRLGAPKAAPDALLAACELAGQERLAALGPVLLQRLLQDAAASGAPGVVLHPNTPAFLRILAQPVLRAALDASPLRLVPLRLPLRPGLWRDAPGELPGEDVALLYGALELEQGGVVRPGRRSASLAPDFAAFARGRELVLVPAARAADTPAAVCVGETCLGLWRWPQLSSMLFQARREAFGPAS